MKAALHETHMDCYVKSFHDEKEIELTGETVVSDKMPDIGLLGDTSSHVVLRGKRTDDGVGVLEGDLQATVCFIPDGTSGCCNLEIVIPWQVEFASDKISDRGIAVGEVRVVQLETRMLNPRKVLIKIQICAEMTVYEKQQLTVFDDAADSIEVQTRKSTVECNLIGTVCEKTFVATDEYPLPVDLHDGKVLCKSVRLRIDDVKTLTNKLIVKGSVLSDVVMATEQGRMERISFTSGFSLILETDCESVSADVKPVLMTTGLYYELSSNGQLLSVEVHGVCQMISYVKHTMTYISDAYSNFCDCKMETREVTVYTDLKAGSQRESLSVSMPLQSQITEILFATANVYKPVRKEKTVHVPLCVSVCVKYENGTMDWLKKQTLAELKVKDIEQILSVKVADIYDAANVDEAVVRVALDVELREERECLLKPVISVETDEEHPCCIMRPSVTVVRRGGCLWDLAREFGSTVEMIRVYNQLEEDTALPNTLLLIPRQNR